ncbi:MAG: DUF6062 family protein [Clostridiales bacterium]|nr:DUF6062 family protein [Clostridiales bacterium]
MKENIYTIPVIESFENGGECAFCAMHEKLTQDAIDFMLGNAYMEDDIRMETNRLGFCKNHLEKLYTQQNRLGLSLIMHTHLQDVNKTVKKLLTDVDKSKGGLFKKTAESKTAKIVKQINSLSQSCYICERINNTFDRYVDTFFYLWKKDSDIKNIVKKSKGFCLNHYAVLLQTGEAKLAPADFNEFLDITVPLQIENFQTLEDDLDWFIKKYDYRFVNEPWKNSKDALPRTLKKIQSVDAK